MVPGNKPGLGRPRCPRPRPALQGFSLLELLVVVALLALASAGVGLALRDTESDRLRAEAERLAFALDSARGLARAAALPVQWRPNPPSTESQAAHFAFTGLPAGPAPDWPTRWLGAPPAVELRRTGTATQPAPRVDALWLGPEPLIPAQEVHLRRGQAHWRLRTDGASAFMVEAMP